jgi:hypothetical protein
MDHGDILAILHRVQCHTCTCSLVITSTLRVGDLPFFRRELGMYMYYQHTMYMQWNTLPVRRYEPSTRRCRMITCMGGMREHCNMIHAWFMKARLQRCQFGEGAVGNWLLASCQNASAPVSTQHTCSEPSRASRRHLTIQHTPTSHCLPSHITVRDVHASAVVLRRHGLPCTLMQA